MPLHQSRRFRVGAGPSPGPAPLLFCHRPRGTYNGAAADSVLLELALSGLEQPVPDTVRRARAVRVSVSGPVHGEANVDAERPFRIVGLASGDYRLRAVSGESGAPLACETEFTVNRELGSEAEP
jgi:hypothetical protein